MKISIITSCFNREATIGQAIESVLSQDYPDIEYIVVWTEPAKTVHWKLSIATRTEYPKLSQSLTKECTKASIKASRQLQGI